ncbi:MAG: (2Fe-2S) ferredoxin domain-containing protein [Peptococcaceae bacterium]|jgi:NADH:ubiquinone oxidoreductase subunit E|nr:(2Fe-2S) ferredoxin domain-containing protein [Peptococcaceae bacterium]
MIEVSVCIGSSCHLKGAYNIIQAFQQMIEENGLHDQIEFKASFCMRQCQNPGVAVSVGRQVHYLAPEDARRFFAAEILGA